MLALASAVHPAAFVACAAFAAFVLLFAAPAAYAVAEVFVCLQEHSKGSTDLPLFTDLPTLQFMVALQYAKAKGEAW